MTVLISDSFNRADSTTTIGTSDSYAGGTNTAWTKFGTTTWGISSNQAYMVSTGSNDNAWMGFDVTNANVKVTITFASWGSTSNQPLMILRAASANNYISVQKTDTNNYASYYYNGSSWSQLGVNNSVSAAPGDVIEATLNGTSVTVKRNGVQLYTFTTSNNLTATKFGIGGHQGAGTSKFDNLIIEDFNTGGSGTTYSGSGTAQGTVSLASTEKQILKSSGTLQGSTNLTSTEKQILTAQGTVQGFANLSSSETLTSFTPTTYQGAGTVQGQANLISSDKLTYKASGTLQGTSNLTSAEVLRAVTVYSEGGISTGFAILTSAETATEHIGIIIEHTLTGERFFYNVAPVTDDPRALKNYVLPRLFKVSNDQTKPDQYQVFLVNAETGQYVETLRWPDNINPLDL